MSWRVVVVSSNAKLDYKLDYLVVRTLNEVRRIHLDEVGVLVLESTAISITAYLLCELMNRKIKVIFCDHQRNPCSELVPMHGSHDSSAKIRQQLNWNEIICQQVWTEIVREKLCRQRDHLLFYQLPQSELLSSYLKQLQWNDNSNREGLAAKVYFGALFGSDFTRSGASPVNAALDYGYSVLLAIINREISAAGYLNQLGICHQNTYNPFNLACDFIEPLRPMVDHAVKSMQPEKLEQEEKRVLLELLTHDVIFDGKRQNLIYAVRLYCASLFRALESGDMSEIKWIEYGW